MLGEAREAAPCLWVRHAGCTREAGALYVSGVAELNIDPAHIILVVSREPIMALQAALEGARCRGLGAVVVELWGAASVYDLTASRRLALAAKASGVPVLVAHMAAVPAPSAAETRWLVRAAPSNMLAARAPGPPAFEMTLLRARNGQEGLRYRVEWDRDARAFVSHSLGDVSGAGAESASSLSGVVVPLSFDGPDAAPARAVRQAG